MSLLSSAGPRFVAFPGVPGTRQAHTEPVTSVLAPGQAASESSSWPVTLGSSDAMLLPPPQVPSPQSHLGRCPDLTFTELRAGTPCAGRSSCPRPHAASPTPHEKVTPVPRLHHAICLAADFTEIGQIVCFSCGTKWERDEYVKKTENSAATPYYSFVIFQAKSTWELSGCTMPLKGALNFLG